MQTTTATKSAPAYRNGHRIHTYAGIRGYCEDNAGLWEPPKLTQKGRTFEPKPGQPGSTIIFEANIDGRTVRMSGEVWSEGPDRGSLWVVKDQIAYLVRG